MDCPSEQTPEHTPERADHGSGLPETRVKTLGSFVRRGVARWRAAAPPVSRLLLLAILLVAACLRFTGLNWDEGQWIHPDEGHMRIITSVVSMPDSLSVYFDTHNSPLNCRNQGHLYSYGTLPLFLTRMTGEWLDSGCGGPSEDGGLGARLSAAWIGLMGVDCEGGSFTGSRSALVGRAFSALSDLGTVLLVYLIARRLYGEAVGLLAAGLSALTVFSIQQAHFFTVDSMACFCVMLTAYLSVRAGQSGRWVDFGLAGLATGLAMACKLDGALAALLVILAAAWWWRNGTAGISARQSDQDGRDPTGTAGIPARQSARKSDQDGRGPTGTAGISARKSARRSDQDGRGPTGTAGIPARQSARKSDQDGRGPTGTATIPARQSARKSDQDGRGPTGTATIPARQSDHKSDQDGRDPTGMGRGPLARASILSAFLRLVLAGVVAFVVFRLAQPYAFEGPGFFGLRPSPEWFGRLSQITAEQGGDVDLPSGRQWTDRTPVVFPWVNIVVWGMGLPLGLAAWAGWALAAVELWRGRRVHLVLWVWATLIFLYQATRWVKSMRYSLTLYPIFAILAAYLLIRLARVPARRWRRVGLALMVGVVLGTAFWAGAFISIYLRPHTRLAASRWIYANVPQGATVANEHWDWGLPLRVDGHDPFGGLYTGLEMTNYDEDTAEKRTRLFDWLDQADYIFLASNRLYASISRLPARYPLTTAYYRALFAGDLGFELAADFTSRPAFGPFQFPDQECPYPLMGPGEAGYVYQTEPIAVRLPPAEEAFSVYDHPRVLIFRKTDAYSRQRVEEVLGGIDVDRALHGLTPREASVAPNALLFDPETWAEQQAGGTWSDMFNRDSLCNRYPGLAAVAWWIVVAALGWLAFPLLFVALPRLRDRGYGLARVLGLLLVAYLTWLLASLHILPNTRGTILALVALLALAGGGVGWWQRDELLRFLRRHWRLILLMEGLFAGVYVLWIGVRLLQPDLWHPVVGGEKPMVLAYLNAVMKSTWFPPYNPWFSGSVINYYYFGFVVVGTLIKLTGTVPTTAYNLAVPLLAALTGLGAFSVAHNLFGGHRRGSVSAGLMALASTTLLGNLGVVHLIRIKLISLGGELFPSTIPGFPQTIAMFRGLWQVIAHGTKLPLRIESWYWHPTRIIPAAQGEVGPITEFPAFTFLYADLHAHMIAFPLVLLALAVIVYWASASRPGWPSLLLGGLVIGALYPTNTWNYHAVLILALAALAVGVWGQASVTRKPRRRLRSDVETFAWRAAVLVGLSRLLYVPYFRHYAAGYTSFNIWEGSLTPWDIFLWIHGMLLFPLLTRMAIEVWRAQARAFRLRVPHARVAALVGLLGLLSITLVLVFLGYEVALVVVPVAVIAGYLILLHVDERYRPDERQRLPHDRFPRVPANRRLLWLMVGEAMAICLGVEILVLQGDVGRMNTVFKFYLQAWLLLSVAGGVSLAWVSEWAEHWRAHWRALWRVGMAALVFGSALFLPYGVRARALDRMSPEVGLTLDGMAYMAHASVHDAPPGQDAQEIPLAGDYAAIRWIQDTIQGSPVILEGLGHREYLWANRVSIYTGLPTVIGWRWHQIQQRMGVLPGTTVDWRRQDVADCYDTLIMSHAWEILTRYGVRYVYVGAYERAYYSPGGLAKFDVMVDQGLLRVAYDVQGVRIYEVMSGAEVPEATGAQDGLGWDRRHPAGIS